MLGFGVWAFVDPGAFKILRLHHQPLAVALPIAAIIEARVPTAAASHSAAALGKLPLAHSVAKTLNNDA